jgi:hypothetical protein
MRILGVVLSSKGCDVLVCILLRGLEKSLLLDDFTN